MPEPRVRRLLIVGLALAAAGVYASPAAQGQAQCPGTNEPGTSAQLSTSTLCLVNSLRAGQGLPALTQDSELAAAARAHATDMVARGYLALRSPDGVTPAQRAASAGYTGSVIGEVVGTGADGQAFPSPVFGGWQSDLPSRAVLLLASARDAGVAVVRGSPGSGAGADNEATYVLYVGAQPVLGQTAIASLVSGDVLIQTPSATGFSQPVKLTGSTVIPVGSIVDATSGKVRIISARDRQGHNQTAQFFDGKFRIRQRKTPHAVTRLELRGGDFSACTVGVSAKRARAARGRTVRRVWGHGKGRYKLSGRTAAGTVRGTFWLTEDRCDGTLIRVKEGSVVVHDLAHQRTVTVTAGHSYFAKRR